MDVTTFGNTNNVFPCHPTKDIFPISGHLRRLKIDKLQFAFNLGRLCRIMNLD